MTVEDYIIAIKGNNQEDITNYLNTNDINSPLNNERQWTSIHYAALDSNIDTFNFLIKFNVDVNVKDTNNNTPLHFAAMTGNVEKAKLLIGRGAKIEVANDAGETPLHIAATNGNLELAKLLIRSGANVNAENKQGETPLHFALYYKKNNEYTEVITLLINNNADTTAKNKKEITPNDVAFQSHKESLPTKESLFNQAKTEFQDAVLKSDYENAKKHLSDMTNSDISVSGNTQLHNAVLAADQAKTKEDKAKFNNLIEILTKNGADNFSKNKSGKIPCELTKDIEIKRCLFGNKAEDRKKQEAIPLVALHNKKSDSLEDHFELL
ncbi:ankyrin repeat domain-containing protein [Thiotrichales bacterium 19S11-10]|nr:ankyrin repeat domain-containing protein [Thiotrichales bacterium 19S11-10]